MAGDSELSGRQLMMLNEAIPALKGRGRVGRGLESHQGRQVAQPRSPLCGETAICGPFPHYSGHSSTRG